MRGGCCTTAKPGARPPQGRLSRLSRKAQAQPHTRTSLAIEEIKLLFLVSTTSLYPYSAAVTDKTDLTVKYCELASPSEAVPHWIGKSKRCWCCSANGLPRTARNWPTGLRRECNDGMVAGSTSVTTAVNSVLTERLLHAFVYAKKR